VDYPEFNSVIAMLVTVVIHIYAACHDTVFSYSPPAPFKHIYS